MNTDFAEPLQQVDRVFVRFRRMKLLYFGGCDYYRLSFHPKILEVFHASLDQHGLSTSASRTTTGNHSLYGQVERRIADVLGAEQAVLASSGYLANIAVAQALRGEIRRAYVDQRCHGSLQDAVRFIGCPVTRFHHRNATDLKRRLARFRRSQILVVTDGVFAFDGSIAPLAEYRAAVGPKALLWVDDAHAAGVLGKGGRGSVEHAALTRQNIVQTVTFSKAFGVYGGAVLCDQRFRRRLIARSSALAGNTPLPLPIASGILSALRLLDGSLRARLSNNVELFWKTLCGHSAPRLTPIIAINTIEPNSLSRALLSKAIYPSFIRYPGGPSGGYFRFALSSEHTPEQVIHFAEVLRAAEVAPHAS